MMIDFMLHLVGYLVLGAVVLAYVTRKPKL